MGSRGSERFLERERRDRQLSTMCGIAGALSWHAPPDLEAVRAMTARLAHRGPDAEGVVDLGPVVLGSRRLSVIDVREANNQPLADASGGYWIVFNGEIYNFLELRARLEQLGCEFRTRGDTEVILEAYKAWGVECLQHLNGMFAFALWDRSRQRLLLARDRAGEKPLFYQALPEGGLIFASELQALRRHPVASRRIDPAAVGQFLSLNYLLTDTCILAGVEKLAPAHYLVIERDRAEGGCYWDLASSFRLKSRFDSEAEAAEALNELIDDSVRLRLVSDVPLGAFLSGGIDSSTVVESMCRLRPPLDNRTFSIGFGEEGYSELPQARAVARALGVAHRDQTVEGDLYDLMPEIVRRFDEPFADTSMIPVYFLAEFARREVTVCLSGDGGDELLAGYETYRADRYHQRLARVPDWVSTPLERLVDGLLPVSLGKVSFDYKLRQFLSGLRLDARRAHHHWRTIFSPEEKRSLLLPEHSALVHLDGFETFDRHFDAVADCHLLDQGSYVDIKTWLVDDILHKVDRATMAHSLESRAPFLDHRLIEFAASLPVDLKLRGRQGKVLLKRARKDSLPRSVIDQRKLGFNAPVSHWLRGPLEAVARRATAAGPLSEWIDPRAVDTLWREHREGVRDHGLKLFGLTSLSLWLDQAP